jgi:HEAT repeat protein
MNLLSPAAIALLLAFAPGSNPLAPAPQSRSVKESIAALSADDPSVRAKAACELKREGDAGVGAIEPLLRLLADGAPVERSVCQERWWHDAELLTTPGEQAAAALVSIGSPAFDALVKVLKQPQWIARRNAAWALGALDDSRAVKPLIGALADSEPDVRAQAAWALGALDDASALEKLTDTVKDADPRVRRQAAWALGVIGDSRATPVLIVALKDADAGVRRQAAWALGNIGK